MATNGSLIITAAGEVEPTTLEPSCLLAFIDETGDEHFSDSAHPVFGLGGCAMLVEDYVAYVLPKWVEMKRQHFWGADVALHANELRSPSRKQLEALSTFFETDVFTRLVAVASRMTAFQVGFVPFQAVAQVLLKRVERAALRFQLSGIALLLESSSRADSKANRYLGHIDTALIERNSGTVQAPIHRYFVPKALHEPGLEVADFIMHAVGGQVRESLKNPSRPRRKDFAAIFDSVPRHAVEYMHIAEVKLSDA